MFLEVLRALEGLSTEFAPMRLQGNVNPNMRCDMVAFYNCDVAVTPRTLKIEIICALATDMTIADMLLSEITVSHPSVAQGRSRGQT